MNDYIEKCEAAMQATLEHLKGELSKVRTGRANVNMLDGIMVEAYGNDTPLNGVALLTVPEAKQILIKPFDKNLIGDIDNAIVRANMGLNPINDGENIRINIPPLTEETRKDLVKDVKGVNEVHKVRIRNARQDANTAIKKDTELIDDDKKGLEKDIQELTNKYNKQLDEICTTKEQEVMKI
ncbi:MAG: ribosome recycling factor [Spiroplasma sp.]|nr:ribosome recycling factor [Mycoplasmatales bacterium]